MSEESESRCVAFVEKMDDHKIELQQHKIELQQHNVAPATHVTDFGNGVLNDDGTCLYSVDNNDVNLIHCVEMRSKGQIIYTLIKNTNSTTNPQKRLGMYLIFHNNCIWMWGTRANVFSQEINTLENELWLFDLNKKEWQQKQLNFIKSSINNRLPSINQEMKSFHNIDLPFPCGRYKNLFKKISSKYAIISGGYIRCKSETYSLHDCYSLNLDTFECKFLFESKEYLHGLCSRPYVVGKKFMIANFEEGCYFLDIKSLVDKMFTIENIDDVDIDSDIDIDYNPIVNSISLGYDDSYPYDSKIILHDINCKNDNNYHNNISEIHYSNQLFNNEKTDFTIYNYKCVNIESENSQKSFKLTKMDDDYPKVIQFWTKNEMDFNDKEKLEADKKVDDQLKKYKRKGSDDNSDILKLEEMIDNGQDMAFNWKRYEYYSLEKNIEKCKYFGLECDGYKMKYGYIWICKYFIPYNEGVYASSDYFHKLDAKIAQKFSKWCLFSLNMYSPLEWSIERLLWIAHYKYKDRCNMSSLPKDIIKKIIHLLQTSVYQSLNKCPSKSYWISVNRWNSSSFI